MILPLQPSFARKRWVYKLVDIGLDPLRFADETDREYDKDSGGVGNLIAPNIIISSEMEGSGYRKFSLFDNYIQVFRYFSFIESGGNIPHLYEVCPYFTKIHFDIDVSADTDPDFSFANMEESGKYTEIVSPYLKAIDKVFSKLFPLNYQPDSFTNNLLVFEAHRPGVKISFHIIVDGYYLPCHECLMFYKEVVGSLIEDGLILQSKFADESVYKKNQNFRMFRSNKASMNGRMGLKCIYSGPPIVISPGRTFSSETMKATSFAHEPMNEKLLNLRVFERSLISNTSGNVRLTLKVNKASESNRKMLMENKCPNRDREVTIKEDLLKKILDVFHSSSLSKTDSGVSAFVFDKIAPGDVICIRRIKENGCKICNRDHKGENIWLSLGSTMDVFMHCRRKSGPKLYVGNCAF